MRYFRFIVFVVTVFLTTNSSLAQQSTGDHVHVFGYRFTVEAGINSSADAARMDSLLMTLDGMVLFAKTDAVTRLSEVHVQNPQIVYESLIYFLGRSGFTISASHSPIEN